MPPFITQNVPLAPKTTLGVGGNAEFFADVQTDAELREVVLWARENGLPVQVLGGGANTLVHDGGVKGLVVHLTNDTITTEDVGDCTHIHAGAGVSLDALVRYTVEHGLWGIENLSHIPSTMGAFPVQNVGAYGVEAKDVITTVTAYDTVHNESKTFTNNECAFAYRHSFFKTEEGKNFIITNVTLSLTHTPSPKLGYKDTIEYFGSNTNPTQQEIRNAIITIRTKKLPDWMRVGTAGSFFKNPIITQETYKRIQKEYSELPSFPEVEGMVKIPLGWVLDKVCGLRGYRKGNVWLHEHQALVLVCEKGTPSLEVDAFVEVVKKSVKEKIGIDIEAEVRVME